MAKRRISHEEGMAALRAIAAQGIDARTPSGATAGAQLPDASTLTAVRYCLEEIAARHPGRSVEIRVPYAGAVQAFDGPAHRRGTPPNVIEMEAGTFLSLALGALTWEDACASGAVHASGARASLEGAVPLFRTLDAPTAPSADEPGAREE